MSNGLSVSPSAGSWTRRGHRRAPAGRPAKRSRSAPTTSCWPYAPITSREQRRVRTSHEACRTLRTITPTFPTVRAVLDEALIDAGKPHLSYQGFRDELVLAECHDRYRRSSVRRIRAANFPRDKWFGDLDFDAKPNTNPATIHTLPPGTGSAKTRPYVLSGTPERGNPTCSSASGSLPPGRGTGSNTLSRTGW